MMKVPLGAPELSPFLTDQTHTDSEMTVKVDVTNMMLQLCHYLLDDYWPGLKPVNQES